MNRRPPDFLIVGAPRSGTSWTNLHLRRHPGIWTPPIKELHYFDVQRRHGRLHRYLPRHLARIWRVFRRLPDERARTDLRENGAWYFRYIFGRRSDEWYLSLFPADPNLIRGETTPNYATLNRQDIDDVLSLCPSVKILFLVRDPVDRILSRITKEFCRERHRSFSQMGEREWTAAVEFAKSRAQFYQTALTNWPAAVAPERFRVFKYEQLKNDPESFIKSVASFVGADPSFYDGDRLLTRRHNSMQNLRDAPVPNHVLSKLNEIMIEENAFLQSKEFHFLTLLPRREAARG